MSRSRAPLHVRFWRQVKKGPGCWEWIGALHESGYGLIGRGGRGEGLIRAHRLSWELAGNALPDDKFLLHKCDNRKCVNPAHLFVGTNQDNVDDMWSKGRGKLPPHKTGAANGNSKYSAMQIRGAKQMLDAGFTVSFVAKSTGISRPHVHRISKGETWKHLS